MTYKFVMELTDDVKGYEEEIEHLERVYGIEPIEEHDKQIRAEVIEEFLKKDKECQERDEECKYMDSEITCLECIAEQLNKQNNTCFDCKYHFMSDCYLECQIKDRINNDNICKNFEKLRERNR